MDMEGFWTGAIEVGSVSFTPVSLILGSVLLILALILQRVLHRVMTRRFFPRFKVHPGLGNAYATLIGYTFLTPSFFLILPITFNGLNWALKDADIEIPYPQRDVYIKIVKSNSGLPQPDEGKTEI